MSCGGLFFTGEFHGGPETTVDLGRKRMFPLTESLSGPKGCPDTKYVDTTYSLARVKSQDLWGGDFRNLLSKLPDPTPTHCPVRPKCPSA